MIVSVEHLFKRLMGYAHVMDVEGQRPEKSCLPLTGDEDVCPRVTGQAELLHILGQSHATLMAFSQFIYIIGTRVPGSLPPNS